MEVFEDARVPHDAVEASVLEVAHGEEEVGEAGALAAEKVGVEVEDPAGFGKSGVVHVVHEGRASCEFRASWNPGEFPLPRAPIRPRGPWKTRTVPSASGGGGLVSIS
jgi:hypothetical protein